MDDVVSGPAGRGATSAAIERALLPFAPLLYLAWTDGVLEEAEITQIVAMIRDQRWIDEPSRGALAHWLDPHAPPSAAELQGLLATIRRVGRALPESQRRSLAQLGMEIARVEGAPERAETRAALEAIEAALGVGSTEALREIIGVEERRGAVQDRSSFEPRDLQALLDGATAATRREVFGILGSNTFRADYTLGVPTQRERVFEWCRLLAARGLGSAAYPPEYGGGGDVARQIVIFETLAFHDLSLVVKYGVQFGLFGGSILQLGTQRHHERFIPAIASLDLPGCFAMTETAHGSNVRDIETVARYDPATGEFVIHTPRPAARKDYIGNAAQHGRLATVFAQLETRGEQHGVHAFLVPIRNDDGTPRAGVTIEDCGHKEGLNGVDNGRIGFDDVRIPRENLLNRFGDVAADGTYSSPIPSASRRFFTMLGTLVAGRISIACAANSVAKTGLTIAVRYTARRRQFGPAGAAEVPVLDYTTMQRRLLPRLAATYALHFALRDLVGQYAAQNHDEAQRIEVLAAGLKAFASDHAVDTLQAGREACGGQGYMSVNRFGSLKADCDVFTTFEGANPVLLQLVAKGLLTDYREQFSEIRAWGILKHLSRRAAANVTALNPIITRRTDPDHLRDDAFLLAAFRYREARLLSSAAQRLKQRLDANTDSFIALNQTQDHLLQLARAHIERVLLESFVQGVSQAGSAPHAAALGRLLRLFALSRIEQDRGWFLESGFIEAGKSRAIRTQVQELCAELRPDAVALVDAFGIPDAVLAAPIAAERQ